MNATTLHPLGSIGFWRGYWTTARPYLFFVSGSAGLVGLSLHPQVHPAVAAAVFIACFFSYGLGQALTDVFQTDTDAISSPYRPLVRGEIAPRHVLIVSLAGLAACAAVLAAIQPATLLLAALAVVGLATYTPLKRRVWGGPPWNSWVVALLPAIGSLAAAPSISGAWAGGLLGWAMASSFFSYAIFVIVGYLKDVEADRATGYRTVCVVLGRKPAVAMSSACLACAAIASLVLVEAAIRDASLATLVAAGLLWAAGLIVLVRSHLRGWRVGSDEDAHPAVADSVRGFVMLHLGQAALLQPGLIPVCWLLWIWFESALVARPATSQI